tara:strand:+ start:526 stop:834 length:309 start_codon:yes stop_codon:yes gene_type:complete
MEYRCWTWTLNNEKMEKTKKKAKIKEMEERIRDTQIENLKYINSKDEKRNNKEISSKRLSERLQIKQRVFNPYLRNSDYLSDLTVQENFLKPKNSNYINLEE